MKGHLVNGGNQIWSGIQTQDPLIQTEEHKW